CHRSCDHSSQALRPNLRVELVRDRSGGEVVAHAAKSTRCEHLSAEALASSDHHAVETPGPRTDERTQNDLIVVGGNANPSDIEIEKLPSLLNYPSVRGVLIQHSENVAVLAVELGHQAQTFCHVRSKPRLRSASPAAHWLRAPRAIITPGREGCNRALQFYPAALHQKSDKISSQVSVSGCCSIPGRL